MAPTTLKAVQIQQYNEPYHVSDVPVPIKLVGSLVADTAEVQELVSIFHNNKLHVDVEEWKLEEVEKMKQEYLSGAGSKKNVVVLD